MAVMASIDTPSSAHPNRYGGITLTLPKEYRPKYRTHDCLLQSSSEQTPLDLNSAVEVSNMINPSVATSYRPRNLPTAPTVALPIPPAMQSGSATISHWQPPATSWTYHPSQTTAPAEVFHTIPRQRGWHGGGRRGWRGGPRRIHYRGRNDFYVGRVSLPSADLESIVSCIVDVERDRSYLAAPKSPLDFFIPKVVHNPPTKAIDLGEQSETCTTWKGLSSVGAEELFTWTNIYHVVSKQRSECVSLSSIAVEMVKHYEQGPPMGLNWFLSAPNIYQRIERFLSMSMETPSLQTEELEVPVVGQDYTLAPHVLRDSDNLSGGFAREIVFSTSENWLTFDESFNAFSGIVPIAPPRNIIVKAKVIEYLDERVRLEHVIRTRVHLRARAAICAEKYLTEIFTHPVMDRKIVNENAKPSKQVSFADEHETDSLHSSPDHLRSFFHELSALTYDPLQDKNAKGRSLPKHPKRKAIPFAGGPVAPLDALPEVKAAMGPCKESGIGYTSQDTTASVTDSPRRRRLASVNSSGQLYPGLRQARSGQEGSLGQQVILRPMNGADFPTRRVAGPDKRHNCTRDSSCGGHHRAGRTWDNPLSLYDGDTNLDLEVALGLSCPDHEALDNTPEPDRPTPLLFGNRFHSLSRCSNMDRPTQACESLTVSEVESQQKDCEVLDHEAFDHTYKDDGIRNFKDLWDDLCQWNWKGWEKEIGITRRSCNKSPIPGPSHEDLKAVDPKIDGGLGQGLADRGGSQNNNSDDTKKEGGMPRDPSLSLHGCLLSPTLSSTTTNKGSSNSSEGSWSMADDVSVLAKATNSVARSGTLYDTVRNQFYEDHQIRQMSSPCHSKSSSARGALSSVFPSSSDQPEPTHVRRDDVKEESAACSSGPRKKVDAESGFQIAEAPASPPSLGFTEEREPDIACIATAVKTSLAVEVLGQDGREKAEIRKGILHHQVMDLRRNERRRDFGSSNYDDIFWSSDEASVEDRLDSGID